MLWMQEHDSGHERARQQEVVMKTGFVSAVLRVAAVAAMPLAALTISAPVSAQGAGQRELFDWRGNVDQEIRVQMQGGRTSVMAMGPREMTGYDNARAMSGVPATNGYVTVQMRQGRGNADVVQQPTAQNGYTTVVRVRDTQSGAGSYDISAFWQPTGNVAYGNGGQYGNYGTYGQYGQYGNYGQYNTYPPRTVIVQQPVYVNRGGAVSGGKTLPVPARTNVIPARPRYQDRVTPNGYENGRTQVGKSLPAAGHAAPQASGHTTHGTAQSGKTLPAAAPNQENPYSHRH
jgi:hypothetical protein